MRVGPNKFPGEDLILIDDMVEDVSIENATTGTTIRMVNISTLSATK